MRNCTRYKKGPALVSRVADLRGWLCGVQCVGIITANVGEEGLSDLSCHISKIGSNYNLVG